MVISEKNLLPDAGTDSIKHQVKQSLTILLVEDTEADAYTVQRVLAKMTSYKCVMLRATSLVEAENIIRERDDIDIVLLDLGLPDSTGPRETYERLEAYKDRFPIVILTSLEDHATALDILSVGAQDYVSKQVIVTQPAMLGRTVEFAMGRHNATAKERQAMLDDISKKDDLLHLMTGGYSVMH